MIPGFLLGTLAFVLDSRDSTCTSPPVKCMFLLVELKGQPAKKTPEGAGGNGQATAVVASTEEEVEFLKRLRFKGKRPTPLYYYRELQNLKDPLHFRRP